MNVLFAAAEAAPFFKSGGLGDVADALPKALYDQGIAIRVVLPAHTCMPDHYWNQLTCLTTFTVQVGWRSAYCGVYHFEKDGIQYYFIDNLAYFDRERIYGYPDDGERYAFFSLAVLEMMERIDFIPDIVHVNDWHTAAIPFLLKDKYHWIEAYKDIKTVLSIHNLKYQGEFDAAVLSDWYGIGHAVYHDRGVKQGHHVNILKGGIYYADWVTTVSPTYAREIQTPAFGHGLDGVLREVSFKLSGILNGIDDQIYNPKTDPFIPVHYNHHTLASKQNNKTFLQKRLGLPQDADVLLIGMVSRLTEQKGFRLVETIMEALMKRPVQVVLLGTGEPQIEHSFKYFDHVYHHMRAVIDFDLELAQQIYAGADIFLMPSVFEPCGLSQMMSMRYGTLPLVHEVGGLKDTVKAYNQYDMTGTGFSFNVFDAWTLLNTIDMALNVYHQQPEHWKALQHQAMNQDVSWQHSTKAYREIYHALAT